MNAIMYRQRGWRELFWAWDHKAYDGTPFMEYDPARDVTVARETLPDDVRPWVETAKTQIRAQAGTGRVAP